MKKIIAVYLLMSLCLGMFAEGSLLNLKVTGMHCGSCESKFKSEAAKIKGIESVKDVSAEKGSASIIYDPVTISAEKAIQSLAENTGYTITATTSMGVVQAGGKPAGCCMKGQEKAGCKMNTKSGSTEPTPVKKEE